MLFSNSPLLQYCSNSPPKQTGNDHKAREVSNTLWVQNPQETMKLMNMMLDDIEALHPLTTAEGAGSTDVADIEFTEA